jgi:hypothetical protein
VHASIAFTYSFTPFCFKSWRPYVCTCTSFTCFLHYGHKYTLFFTLYRAPLMAERVRRHGGQKKLGERGWQLVTKNKKRSTMNSAGRRRTYVRTSRCFAWPAASLALATRRWPAAAHCRSYLLPLCPAAAHAAHPPTPAGQHHADAAQRASS